jgi:hypothetical protein
MVADAVAIGNDLKILGPARGVWVRCPPPALTCDCVFHSDVVQAFRPARYGGPDGPHDTQSENAPGKIAVVCADSATCPIGEMNRQNTPDDAASDPFVPPQIPIWAA